MMILWVWNGFHDKLKGSIKLCLTYTRSGCAPGASVEVAKIQLHLDPAYSDTSITSARAHSLVTFQITKYSPPPQ